MSALLLATGGRIHRWPYRRCS